MRDNQNRTVNNRSSSTFDDDGSAMLADLTKAEESGKPSLSSYAVMYEILAKFAARILGDIDAVQAGHMPASRMKRRRRYYAMTTAQSLTSAHLYQPTEWHLSAAFAQHLDLVDKADNWRGFLVYKSDDNRLIERYFMIRIDDLARAVQANIDGQDDDAKTEIALNAIVRRMTFDCLGLLPPGMTPAT